MKKELESYSLKELKKIRNDVEKAIINYEHIKLAEARSALSAKASELGYSLDEILGAVATRKRTPAKPKYQHPTQLGLVWTGRGRAPRWMVDLEISGKNRAEFLISE